MILICASDPVLIAVIEFCYGVESMFWSSEENLIIKAIFSLAITNFHKIQTTLKGIFLY